MRQFIRHPASIPIEIDTCSGAGAPRTYERRRVVDVSFGGLAFDSDQQLDQGSLVALRITLVRPVFQAVARVAWCRAATSGYRVGAEFLNLQDEYRARMVEQICYIEAYRRQVLELEHRDLTTEQAAMEWITKYAARFPGESVKKLYD
jgi:hypothetical protein